ncbi:unnamed protein product [Somion occarium]|uniref:Integral membrane protein n=1 Tax=Somion occarium TaxID=3059160 RepID=A0ABP1DUK2_9APHY
MFAQDTSSLSVDRPQSGANGQIAEPRFTTHRKRLHRPFSWFYPTRVVLHPEVPSSDQARPSLESSWNSRASRKRRYTRRPINLEPVTSPVGWVLTEQRLRHPGTELKVHLSWDISFWVAVIFILGSTCWIVNGFYLFLPLVNIGSDHTTAAAWWAFAGGTLFELGSYLMYVEAINTGHDQLFGPALWGLVSGKSEASEDGCDEKENEIKKQSFRWIGVGSYRDLGFLACFTQMFAATIFWVSTITGLPHVIPNLSTSPPVAIADVFFWTPQVIGGSGFIISSILLMEEVQVAWWKPSLTSLGWHVALWNLIGAVGFTLCGAFGYGALSSSGIAYQSVLSTFWGSFAFEIGSVVQFWETLWREPPSESQT